MYFLIYSKVLDFIDNRDWRLILSISGLSSIEFELFLSFCKYFVNVIIFEKSVGIMYILETDGIVMGFHQQRYIPLDGKRSNIVQTAWGLMGLISSGQASSLHLYLSFFLLQKQRFDYLTLINYEILPYL